MENRLTACMNKRYQLESLNVTKMHIKAVQITTKTYRQFLDEHDIEKVERLQDTLAEMIEDACEINETLTTPQSAFQIDDDEVEREYESICAEVQLPIAPTEFPSIFPVVESKSESESEELEMVPLTG
jgi:phosphate uptake regulator